MNAPIVNLRYVLLNVFCSLSGYTDKAVRRKLEDGVWVEGRHYKKLPDGHIAMDMQAFYKWCEGYKNG